MIGTTNYLVDLTIFGNETKNIFYGVRIFNPFLKKENVEEQIREVFKKEFALYDYDYLELGVTGNIKFSINTIKKVSINYLEENRIFPITVIGEPDAETQERLMASGYLQDWEVTMSAETVVRNLEDFEEGAEEV